MLITSGKKASLAIPLRNDGNVPTTKSPATYTLIVSTDGTEAGAVFQTTAGNPQSSAFWVLNVMRLGSPQSAILSAVIFNALVIIALIPLALRGVRYRPLGAAALLRRNLVVYGAGGVVAPFVAIKLIDLAVRGLHLG